MSLITWNPSDKNTGVTLSNGNLTISGAGLASGVRTTIGKVSGKWYWEIDLNQVGHCGIGIATLDSVLSWAYKASFPKARIYSSQGKKTYDVAYGNIFTTGDIIGVAVDLDIGTIEFFKNGVSQGIAHTDLNTLGVALYPYLINGGSSSTYIATANFGAVEFKYPPPQNYQPYDIDNANWLNIKRHILKSNNLIYSLDISNNLVDITSQIADINNITQLEYETLGFDDMSLIDMTQLGNLQSPKSVIYYTDDTAITNPKLKHEYSFNIGTRLLKRG